MSENNESFFESFWDKAAIEIQNLYNNGKLNNQPLLQIDNRKENETAQYQFDIVNSVLHRTGCNAIPEHSRSALYSLWEIKKEDLQFACGKCKPEIQIKMKMDRFNTSDLLYGLFSIIDQFGHVLSEKGREYRKTDKGRQMETLFNDVFDELGIQQKKSFDFLFSSFDDLIGLLRSYNNGNGSNGKTNGAVKNGKQMLKNKNNGKAGLKKEMKLKQHKKIISKTK